MYIIDVQRQPSLPKSKVEAFIQDILDESWFIRDIYQISDVIDHAP